VNRTELEEETKEEGTQRSEEAKKIWNGMNQTMKR
jgi:hypothetical protein